MKTLKYTLLFLTTILFTMCSLNVIRDSGGASETVNGFLIIRDTTIEIRTTAEKDLEMEVYIVKDSSSPIDSADIYNASIVSNSDTLKKSTSPGIYNIFLLNKDSLLSCSFFKIRLFKNEKDSLTDTFSTSGSINGSIIVSDTMSKQQVPVFVYLRGTPFYKHLIDNYTYSFEHIPRGSYTIVAEVEKVAEAAADANPEDGSLKAGKKYPVVQKSNEWSQQASEKISLESGESIEGLKLHLSD